MQEEECLGFQQLGIHGECREKWAVQVVVRSASLPHTI